MNYVIFFSTIQLLIFTFSLGGLYPAKQSLAHWLSQTRIHTHTHTRGVGSVSFGSLLPSFHCFLLWSLHFAMKCTFQLDSRSVLFFVRSFVCHNCGGCPKLNLAWFGFGFSSSTALVCSIALNRFNIYYFSEFSISCIWLLSLSLPITLRSPIIMPTICGLAFIVPHFIFFSLSCLFVVSTWAIVLFNN